MNYNTEMTSLKLETHWLSLNYWLTRCVLPSAVTLGGVIVLLKIFFEASRHQDQTAIIVGFSTLYFVLFRAGHLWMIRSMHFDMKRCFGEAYEKRLENLPDDLRRQNLGFTLARIKRALIDEQDSKRPG